MMKGLLVKDLCLLKQQKNMILTMTFVAVIMSFSIKNASFIVSYISMIAISLTIGTVTYDDYAHGMAFLLTLPASRKDYIKEKYVFGITLTTVIWLLVSIFTRVVNIEYKQVSMTEHLSICGVIIGVTLIMLAVMLPIQIKFGAERSRVALFIITGIITLFIVLGISASDSIGVNIQNLINLIEKIDIQWIVAYLVITVIAIIVISYNISLRIIKKKEY